MSQHSVPVLIGCLILTGLGAAGLPFLHAENNMIKLWIPQVRVKLGVAKGCVEQISVSPRSFDHFLWLVYYEDCLQTLT